MGELKLRPDSFTFPSVINACAGLQDINMGSIVHNHVREVGFLSDLYIGNSLIDMYARFGCLDQAQAVFDGISNRDVVSWNSLISGYCANGESNKAIKLYFQMKVDGLSPDSFTMASVMLASGILEAMEVGEITHGFVTKLGIEDSTLLGNALIAMYCKFNNLRGAQKAFDKMVVKDKVSWNTLIGGYSQIGMFDKAIKLFQEMIVRFKPDILTIATVLRACGQMGDLEQGRLVHQYMMRNGFVMDTTAGNILVTMYASCGSLEESRKIFNQMPHKDCVSWNSLIKACTNQGCLDEGLELFKMMTKMDVKPDSITYVTMLNLSTQLRGLILGRELHTNVIKMNLDGNLVVGSALIDMYAKCGCEEDALRKFEMMKSRDVVTWNTVIAGCVHTGNCSFGLQLLSRMRAEGIILDMASILGVLPACSFLAAKRQGKEIHGCILRFGLEYEVPIGNALIEMYSRCGIMVSSIHVFNQMKLKDVVSWTAMISTYGMYGQGENALRVFEEMEENGIKPDHVTFIALFFACSHTGLVDEGLTCFNRMEKNYKIKPVIEHYACIVDLLSRSGRLDEAYKFIQTMPLKPDAGIWGALLSGCRVMGETKIAERVSEQIMRLDSDNTGYYILISNLYAALGKWDRVTKIRKSIKARGLRKDPGYSWMEIRNRVYVFGTGDRLVEQSEQVYQLLERLGGLMAKEGYVADKKFVLHDVEEDDKRDMLCGHSERLAIAFGLLNTKPGTPIQIMKNLRVCGDCHTATKYISKIMQREFIVRDANRFHLFKNGICSCGDYW